MTVKQIPKTEPKGATRLTPIDMNKIPFDTGHHSDVPSADSRPTASKK